MDSQSNISAGPNGPPAEPNEPVASMYDDIEEALFVQTLSDVRIKEEPEEEQVTEPKPQLTKARKARAQIPPTFSEEEKKLARRALGFPSADNNNASENARPASGFQPTIFDEQRAQNQQAALGFAGDINNPNSSAVCPYFSPTPSFPSSPGQTRPLPPAGITNMTSADTTLGGGLLISEDMAPFLNFSPIQSSTPLPGQAPHGAPAAINRSTGHIDFAGRATTNLPQIGYEIRQEDTQTWIQTSGQSIQELPAYHSTPSPDQAPSDDPAAVPNPPGHIDHESLQEDIHSTNERMRWSQASGPAIEAQPGQPSTPSSDPAPSDEPAAVRNLPGLVDLATQATLLLFERDHDALMKDIEAQDESTPYLEEAGRPVEEEEEQQKRAEKREWKTMLEDYAEAFRFQARDYRSTLEPHQPATEEVPHGGPTPPADGGEGDTAAEYGMDVDY